MSFMTQVPTSVKVTPVPGKCILVSGHDMTDLEQILQQTEGKGINVFTHGELVCNSTAILHRCIF